MSAGERWVAAGRPPAARRAWVRGARHHPSTTLLARLEDHYAANGNGERLTAIYRGLRRSHPDDVTLGLMFVRHLLAIGELDEAARTLDALPTTAPAPLVSALRGALLRRRGDDGPAAGALAEAIGPGLGLTSNHRCTACSRDVEEWTARCPSCRQWNTIEAPADRVMSRPNSSGNAI